MLVAQPPTTPASPAQQRAIPATLAKRLAEALDGFREGGRVWIVASYEFDHQVAGFFQDFAEAQATVRRLGGEYDVFGPFLQPLDFDRPSIFFIECHDPPTRDWCPWFSPVESVLPLFRDVDSVRLEVFSRSVAPIRRTFSPQRVDAMFFSLSALDKFVYPYYARLFGVDYAKSLRDSLVVRLQRSGAR